MMKPNRPNIAKGGTYPPEFREEAVRYWLSSAQTLKQVASEMGVSPECLRLCLRLKLTSKPEHVGVGLRQSKTSARSAQTFAFGLWLKIGAAGEKSRGSPSYRSGVLECLERAVLATKDGFCVCSYRGATLERR